MYLKSTYLREIELVRDKADPGSSQIKNLPEWNLDDLYSSENDKNLTIDLKWLDKECTKFENDFKNKLSKLSAQNFLKCILRYEKIQNISGRIMSFAGLKYYQSTTDPKRAKFLADMQDKITVSSSKLVFFSLEINNIDNKKINSLLKGDVQLSRFKPIFDSLRKMKNHQLSTELEAFLHDQSVVGTSAWNRLFDETIAGLKFTINNEELNIESTLNLLSDNDRKTRELGAKEVARVLGKNINIFSRITNTLAKEKEIEDRWRKMPSPQFGRHLSNDVEPEVVEALRNAVVSAYPETSHRYYKLKAKWMGLKKMEIWDRNAPLPNQDNQIVNWADAQKTVLDAYRDFSPKMAEIAEPFFHKGWIDAEVKAGKAPGAFAHPTVTNVHPYIMLNYLGKPRDVMTLAHELGHGVHQVLAAKQGELLSSTPLTLAETASVFGEMLTFNKILGNADSNAERKVLLAGKVEDMINTVIRQIAFYDFECKLHEARSLGELTPSQINEIWMSVQVESLGPCFNFMEGYETFWAYVPHFIHSPFYVYAYAFGDGLVNALYSVYEEGLPNFDLKYFEMLKAGGSKHHSELLKPFGLDASDPKFWNKGLSVISKMIDELEMMEES
ncbi:MAG: M3 family oligoendopeptidase [Paracoccaceae bacterium]|jgi:oligoendopeptidase F|nr:M3 family oligoendopeptidase [Paracoccaceae bacterium]|tara:strand:+ start:5023 stop:6864 length:1842 start_codon:yes stop_codon:yes gene_type:complete